MVKRYNPYSSLKYRGLFAFLCVAVPLFFGVITWSCLYCDLPNEKKPVKLYATSRRANLKKTFIDAINQAKHSIICHTYTLNDPEMLSLLNKRSKDGIAITCLFDKKASPKTLHKKLNPSINLLPKASSGLAHEKILMIDKHLTFIGSANFSMKSLEMHDNLVLGVADKELNALICEGKTASYRLGNRSLTCYFLPKSGDEALDHLISEIELATHSIYASLFTFTHPLIVNALIEAKERGVDVKLCIDRTSARGASKKAVSACLAEGLTVMTHTRKGLLHHKWALIDESQLIMGSANWTKSAFSKNRELLLFIEDMTPKEINYIKKLWKTIYKTSENAN